jgi:hypothetical protein
MRHKPSAIPQPRHSAPLLTAPLHVEIGKLTIEGYTRVQQRLFTESFRSSLHTLTNSLDLRQLDANRTIRRLDAGSLRTGASAKEAGQELARRIYSSIFDSCGRKS